MQKMMGLNHKVHSFSVCEFSLLYEASKMMQKMKGLSMRVVPVNRGLLLKHETVYQKFYDIFRICLYTYMNHFVSIWVESQFR